MYERSSSGLSFVTIYCNDFDVELCMEIMELVAAWSFGP